MMHKKLRIAFLLIFTILFGKANAQTNFADYRVKVSDQNGKALSGVLVKMILNNIEKDNDTSDADGNVVFQTLPPGTYDVEITKKGFRGVRQTGVTLQSGTNEPLEIGLSAGAEGVIGAVDIKGKTKSVINLHNNEPSITGTKVINSARSGFGILAGTNSAIVETPGGYSIRGTRVDGNGTFQDGVRVIGGGDAGRLGTEQIGVSIGGIRAMYGDLTGGAFTSTTKSATSKTIAMFEGTTSQMLDPYGYNRLEGFVSGPLWIKKVLGENGKQENLVRLGYTMDVTLNYTQDPSPSRNGQFILNAEKQKQIQDNPLRSTPTGFVNEAAFLRASDFTWQAAHKNAAQYNGGAWGKLEFNPNKLISVIGFLQYNAGAGRGASQSVMNYMNNGYFSNQTVRSYVQFKQNFKVDKTSNIKSAFYSIRAEYQDFRTYNAAADHMDNIFDYGYVGTFTSKPAEVFQYSNYDPSQNPNKEPRTVVDQFGNTVQLRNYWELAGYSDSAMNFKGSDLNPIRAHYTQKIYDYYASRGLKVTNSSQVLMSQGLMNGYNPTNVYSLFNTPGVITSGWSKSETEKYSLFALGQMQYKPKSIGSRERAPHDLQAGFYYEQMVYRGYSLGANSLWILMNQYMNSHITELDVNHPILSYDQNGVFTDTVRYNRLVNSDQQTYFDKHFRQSLIESGAKDVYGRKVTEQTFIDINSYKPSDFKLNMFNADELLNNGNGIVNYYGYDYLGNKISGKPSINKFLNDKNNRTIGAFQPVYMAAWLEDQFQFKDLIFRLGLRMERYDANQLVLRDAYSLYPIHTVGEVKELNGVPVSHPTNMGGNYAVYVNDIQSPTKIIGYRNGDRWYNADGSEQKSPDFLANQTSNGKIAPYLVDVKNQIVSEKTFTDYTPAINLLPRVWFSFPLEPGRKTFYVSYDVLAQRPSMGTSFLSVDDIYYLKFRQGNQIANGSLNPRIKTDYEVGYKQIIGTKKDKGLELAASYTEIRNDFGLFQINNAYPVTYITFRNIDFSTITSFRGTYNMMDIGPLNLTASYMLQFADGTGSNTSSQQALIASNQPNLRNVIPLGELDIRHNLKMMATFAWQGGKDPVTKKNFYNGPIINGVEIFRNTSISFIANTYSGAPYTPTTQPVQIGAVGRAQIKGVPFGARLPWQYNFDINVTKAFMMNRNLKKPLMFNAFLIVSNVLNTYNILGVYPYTGSANDDGFLNSPQGQLVIKTQVDAQSYIDYYKMFLNSNAGYNAPRTIRLGIRLTLN